MELRFLGSGDAFGAGGRFNTCIYVRSAGSTFLVDCGASSMIAFRKFDVDPNTVRTIFLTHLHGDHFGGLPFFILDGQLVSKRTTPLTIVGPPGVQERVTAAMEIMFPGSSKVHHGFTIDFREYEPGFGEEVEGIRFRPYEVKHGGGQAFALRLTIDGKTLCYSGDTEWIETLREAARGVDLFITECYFFDKPAKFHLNYQTLAQHLPQIGAKRVLLTHMSTEMLTHSADVKCEMAQDGMSITL